MVNAALNPTSISAPASAGLVAASGPAAAGAVPGSGADGTFGRLFRAQAASASAAGASGTVVAQGTAADEVEAAKAKAGSGVGSGQNVAGADGKLLGAARAGSGTDAVSENAFTAAQHDAEVRKSSAAISAGNLDIAGEVAAGEPAWDVGVSGGDGKDKTPGKDKKDSMDSKHSGADSTPVAAVSATGFAAQAAASAPVSSGLPASSLHAAGAGSDTAQTAGASTSPLHAALADTGRGAGSASGSVSGSMSGSASGSVSVAASGTVLNAKVMAQSAGEPASIPNAGSGTGLGKDAPTGKTLAVKAQATVAVPPVTAVALPGAAKAALDAVPHGVSATGVRARAAGSTTQAGSQAGTLSAGAALASGAPAGSGPAAHSAAAPLTASGAGMTTAASSSPYARMDQGVAPVVLHSGAQQVAVGVRDSSLGWVEIRAQNVSGHVDATLVAASGQTQASLASQLPAMAQFVAQQDVRLGTLVVQQQASSSAGGGFGGGMSHGSGAGQSGANPNGANPGGSNPGGGFNSGGFAGGFGNPSGGHHSPSSHSTLGVGRSVGGVPAAGVSGSQALYESGEDADFGPVSYINVRA